MTGEALATDRSLYREDHDTCSICNGLLEANDRHETIHFRNQKLCQDCWNGMMEVLRENEGFPFAPARTEDRLKYGKNPWLYIRPFVFSSEFWRLCQNLFNQFVLRYWCFLLLTVLLYSGYQLLLFEEILSRIWGGPHPDILFELLFCIMIMSVVVNIGIHIFLVLVGFVFIPQTVEHWCRTKQWLPTINKLREVVTLKMIWKTVTTMIMFSICMALGFMLAAVGALYFFCCFFLTPYQVGVRGYAGTSALKEGFRMAGRERHWYDSQIFNYIKGLMLLAATALVSFAIIPKFYGHRFYYYPNAGFFLFSLNKIVCDSLTVFFFYFWCFQSSLMCIVLEASRERETIIGQI